MTHFPRNIAVYVFVGSLIFVITAGVSIAFASLTFSGASLSGNSPIVIDGSSTISIGTSTATGITIGNGNAILSVPGSLTVGGTAFPPSAPSGTLGANIIYTQNGALNVKAFGAVGDGLSHPLSSKFATLAAAQAVYPFATSLTQELDWAGFMAAFTALPSGGGNIFIPDSAGYLINAQIPVTKTSHWYIGCTLITVSGVPAEQTSPFGANFYITAPNTWFESSGCAHFKSAPGSQANIFTFASPANAGGLRGLELDGNKTNNSGIVDDTFESGVFILFAPTSTADAAITIENCDIHDFLQYGISTFGQESGGNEIFDNSIHDNGKVGDPQSVGGGITINLGSSRNTIGPGNDVYNQTGAGIRISSAGTAASDNKVTDNTVYSNGEDGIILNEEADYGSIANVGQTTPLIQGNSSYLNGGSGIRILTSDNVGVIANGIVTGNSTYSNSVYGIFVSGNSNPTSNTRQIQITDNTAIDNTMGGIAVGASVLDSVVMNNIAISNGGTSQIVDLGTRTFVLGNKTNTTSTGIGIGTISASTTLQVSGASSTIRIGGMTACLEMANSDGSAGLNYLTVLNGVLSATTTQPSACQ